MSILNYLSLGISVVKALASQVWGPEFDSSELDKCWVPPPRALLPNSSLRKQKQNPQKQLWASLRALASLNKEEE